MALLSATVLATIIFFSTKRSARCYTLEKTECAAKAQELARRVVARAARSGVPASKFVCVFDLDDTLIDIGNVVGRHRNIALYGPIAHNVQLWHSLQKMGCRMVILTARPKNTEPLVVRNCAKAGITLNSDDVVAICPARGKAAWRARFAKKDNLRLLLVAGDRNTDVNTSGAIALRVHPESESDVVCDNGKAFCKI